MTSGSNVGEIPPSPPAQVLGLIAGAFVSKALAVAAQLDVAEHLSRSPLTADELGAFRLVGADEYFGLLMPRAGAALTLPDGTRENVRAAIADNLAQDIQDEL